ncbi:non-canonical purine NTP diphosphatase [Flavobacterium sp. LB2R40]|uniref:non-canonical purine NTP diphosphatase n=1 Tax=unclassified Flavobacterium TaxID=196869 RepID=UPI003AB06AEF
MQLVFASNNKNKILELQSMLPASITILSLESIGCFEEIPETQNTIEGNAIQKANYVTEKYGYDCFADDTGLEVDSLHGEPGVYSARYAGEQRNTVDNMNKLLAALSDKSNRKAQFKTVITLNLKGQQYHFTGIARGEITLEKTGNQGFGYDPVFQPEGFSETFAQLSLEIKNKISHRGKATQQLIKFLNKKKNEKPVFHEK